MTEPAPLLAPLEAGTITIGVVSPYPTMRAGIRALLNADPRCLVIAEGMSVETLSPLGPAALDVLVLELEPPSSLESLLDDSEPFVSHAVVLLGTLPDQPRLLARLAPRPWSLLPRDASEHELIAAVMATNDGLVTLDVRYAAAMLSAVPTPRAIEAMGDHAVEELTARELEVLALLAEGIPNKTIARRLNISEHTVKFHVGSLLSKLNAASRTEAVRIGARRGLIAL